jgi:hypothetical protein
MTSDRDLSRGLVRASDAELENQLRQLGQSIEWPAAPGLASSVRDRLAAEPQVRQRPSPARWRLPQNRVRRAVFLALAAILLIATVAVALGLGLPGIGIRFGPLPTITPTSSPVPAMSGPSAPPATTTGEPSSSAASPDPSAGGLGASLFLGRVVTLDEAVAGVDWSVVMPTLLDLAPPVETWLDGSGRTAALTFVWPADEAHPAAPSSEVGVLLTQFRGSVRSEFLQKTLGPDTRLVPVLVGGERGFWIEGAPHTISYPVAGDGLTQDRTRLAGNVLIWTRAELTLRLEVAGTMEEALDIAASLAGEAAPTASPGT